MSTTQELDAREPPSGSVPQRYALLDAVPALILSVVPLGLEAMFANGRFRAYTGLSGTAALGQGWLEALHPEDVGTAKALLEAPEGEDGGGAAAECRLRRHDGQYRRHGCRVESVLDGSGRTLERIVSCVDVDAERAADEPRALLAAIVDDSDDAIISKSLDGVIRSWNAAAERLFGYSAAEAVGQPLTLIIPPERLHEEEEILAKLRRGERIDHFETVRIAKGGRRIDISVTISPIRDEAGNAIGASKVARDITDQKRAEAELRAADEKYRELVETANSAIIRWRCDGTITFANDFAEALFGYPDGTLQGSDVRVLVPSQDSRGADLGQLVNDIVARPARYRNNVNENVTRDGRRLWMLWTNRPVFDERHRVAEILAVGSDITKLKRAEEALREADRRKNEFLAVLGHELRNPLAPLSTGLELLQKTAVDSELADKVLAMMTRQLRHLVRLVNDLVDVARISRGTVELRRERLDMRDVMKAAVELVRPSLTERRHALVLPSSWQALPVEGDLERLTQVLANILNNAAKYTPTGGKITVRTCVLGDHVQVHVADNGLGIPPERLEELFDMFSRVPEHRAHDPGSGLGIGLALSRQLIQLHGGTIEAHSEGLGLGSEFIVRVPRSTTAGASRLQAGPALPAGGTTPRRILLVDDNVDAAESLLALLRLEGHEVEAVHDGRAALSAAARLSPDVVLLDIGLPHIDGYEVARRLRARPDGERMLLVALTGWGQERDRRRSKEAGFDAHVTKPVETAALTRLIAGAHGESSAGPHAGK